MRSHNIDYKIVGEDIQFVELSVNPRETVIAEAGNFMMMEDGIEMETLFGDGRETKGFGSKLLGAGKRLLTGESLFMTTYTNNVSEVKNLAFSAPYPGKIIPLDLNDYDGKIVCQKDSFLCAIKGVSVGMEFSKKLSAGFFGGEGFILQKLEGEGLVFVHAGGTVVKKELKDGELLRIDTGCLVAMTKEVQYEIEMIKSVKSMTFGGNGLFNTVIKGSGTVWIQSMPFSKLAGNIFAAAPQSSGSSGAGILGELFD